MNRSSINTSGKRIPGVDLVKVVAALFVLGLHLNGYARALMQADYTSEVHLAYYIIEAMLIPAIHLFVLCGCWLIISHGGGSLRSVLAIWFQTSLVCLVGLIIMYIFDATSITTKGFLICVFPIIGRSYWYCSAYVLFILISPMLLIVVNALSDSQLYTCTGIVLLFTVVLPSFLGHLGWEWSNDTLFIALFFSAACIQRSNLIQNLSIWPFLLGCIVSIVLMVLSVYANETVAIYIKSAAKDSMLLYNYSSILVVSHGICLFCLLMKINLKPRLHSIIARIGKYSLIIYLLHMHPIIKLHYTEWKLLSPLFSTSGIAYSLKLLFAATICFFCLCMCGVPFVACATRLSRNALAFVYKHPRLASIAHDIGVRI